MPRWPARRASQVSSVPIPSGVTRPTPVTTTLRDNAGSPKLAPYFLVFFLLDVVDGVLHGGDLLGVLVGNVEFERFFERHHQLDDVERIGAKIIDERRGVIHLAFVHAELLDDDLLHSLFNRHESSQTVCKLIDSSYDGDGPQLHPVKGASHGLPILYNSTR